MERNPWYCAAFVPVPAAAVLSSKDGKNSEPKGYRRCDGISSSLVVASNVYLSCVRDVLDAPLWDARGLQPTIFTPSNTPTAAWSGASQRPSHDLQLSPQCVGCSNVGCICRPDQVLASPPRAHLVDEEGLSVNPHWPWRHCRGAQTLASPSEPTGTARGCLAAP